MLNLLDPTADVLAVRLDGPAEQRDLEARLALLRERLQSREAAGLYLEVPEPESFFLSPCSGLVLGAVALMPLLGRFARIAVVTGNPWLRCWTRLAAAALPTTRIEAFEPREQALALAWARREQDLPHGASLAIIETRNPHVLGLEVDGRFTAQEMRALTDRLNTALADRRPLRLLYRVVRVDGFEAPVCLLTSEVLKLRRGLLDRLERCALVGPDWLREWARMMNRTLHAHVRHFKPDEEAVAWEWLGAEPRAESPLVVA